MRRTILPSVSGISLWLLIIAATAQLPAPPRSVSTSRQFIVYGSDAQLRGAICDLAERTKATALRLLSESDAWKTPILVNAQISQANLPELPTARLTFSQTGSGLKLQLDVMIPREIDVGRIEQELLRAIFIEMMYRQHPDTPAGTAFVEPPPWLIEGTLGLTAGRDLSSARERLRSSLDSGRALPLDNFLQQQPALLDSPSRALHQAYSAALVALTTEAPDGRKRLARFIADLSRSSVDSVADFHAHFSIFDDTSGAMDTSWKNGLALWAAGDRYRILTSAETEARLLEILRVQVPATDQSVKTYALEEYPEFVRLPALRSALRRLTNDLMLVSARANPLYAPIIFEYERIAEQLARKKTKRITQRLAAARALREGISRTMQGINDYLNWFEATQSRSASDAFRAVLATA
ncbi:MAG: hypothetical protein M3Z22_06685, partial [Verrucomicrobiota bacterium]|nr:hypothetical protein [Verrucomicrobiota bacterium]